MLKIKKKTFVASVSAFIVYPVALIFAFVVNLFQDRSFGFFGFKLLVEKSEQSAALALSIKPVFFTSFLIVFVIVLGFLFLFERFKKQT